MARQYVNEAITFVYVCVERREKNIHHIEDRQKKNMRLVCSFYNFKALCGEKVKKYIYLRRMT